MKKLSEISKATLGSYVNKASKSAAHASGMAHRRFGRGTREDDRAGDELEKKANKRLAGISKATSRLAKEEVELDEIHDRYIRSHGKKASGRGRWMFTDKRMGDVAHKDMYHHDKEDTVSKAAAAARKHFGKKEVYVMEEVELDELSKDTLGSYAKKNIKTSLKGTMPSNRSAQRTTGINRALNKMRKIDQYKEEVELDEATSPYHKAAAHLEKMTKDPKFSRAYKEDIPDIKSHIDHLKSNDPTRHKQSARHVRNHDTIIRDIVSDAVHKNSSKEHSKAWHDHAGLQRLREGTEAYGKSMDAIADKRKKAGMTASDKNKLSKVADLMRKEREKRAAMQETVTLSDIRRKKEREEARKKEGRDSETQHQRMTRKVYGNMMGGLKKEEYALDEVAGQRGRPKKGEGQESDKHIIMQLRSAQDLGGKKDIKFSSGKTAQVHPDHISKILKMHDSLQKPEQKRRLRVAIGRSHDHLKRVANAIK